MILYFEELRENWEATEIPKIIQKFRMNMIGIGMATLQ
jgi:hypothetical protein